MSVSALSVKLDEIAALVARDLGLGDVAGLAPEVRTEVYDEAVSAVEAWSEAEVEDATPLEARTELQHLLAEYREIEDRILDNRDDALDEGD